MMMTRICKLIINIFIFLIFISSGNFLFSEEKSWVLAFDHFKVQSAVTSSLSVSESFAKTLSEQIPMMIAENFSSSQIRTISKQEEKDRSLNKLKEERISLYLQLDSAIKTKDGFVLQNISESALKTKRLEQEKKIQELQEKIKLNIEKQNEVFEAAEKESSFGEEKKELSEAEKYARLFKGLFTTNEASLTQERVLIYENKGSCFFDSEDNDVQSRAFIKKIANAKIDALITGKISVIGDYMSVTCSMLVYPGAREVCTVTEIGGVADSDFISKSLASSLIPYVSSSLPSTLNICVQPEEALKNMTFSVDDVVYKGEGILSSLTVHSGVHALRFECPGYRTAVTNFFFEGNETYKVDVQLKEISDIKMKLVLPSSFSGQIYANGELQTNVLNLEEPAVIKINDSEVLGLFMESGTDKGAGGFFYVPENLVFENSVVSVQPKLFDKSEYIDGRRKWMYTSYSIFLISILTSVWTYGNYVTTLNGFQMTGNTSQSLYNETRMWNTAFLVTGSISVASGGFFIYELVRYLQSADSVLPVSAKKVKDK